MKLFEVMRDGIDYSLPLKQRYAHLPRQQRVERIMSTLGYTGKWNFVYDEDDNDMIDLTESFAVVGSTLHEIPFKIYSSQTFTWKNGRLKTLDGAPGMVSGNFDVSGNRLESLHLGPHEVDGNYDCSNNRLKNLKGSPDVLAGSFTANNNDLETLEGLTDYVGGNLFISNNDLTSLEHLPIEVAHTLDLTKNHLTSLVGIAKKLEHCEFIDVSGNNIEKGGLEVINIKGLRVIQGVDSKFDSIIKKYLRKPDDLFTCQAELIDAGLEEYTEL